MTNKDLALRLTSEVDEFAKSYEPSERQTENEILLLKSIVFNNILINDEDPKLIPPLIRSYAILEGLLRGVSIGNFDGLDISFGEISSEKNEAV